MMFRAAAVAGLAVGGLAVFTGLGGAPVGADTSSVTATAPIARNAAAGRGTVGYVAGAVSQATQGVVSGTASLAETGWQVAEGAYYLGGEIVESTRIIGVSTLQMVGLVSTEGAQDLQRLGEQGLAGLWWGTATGEAGEGAATGVEAEIAAAPALTGWLVSPSGTQTSRTQPDGTRLAPDTRRAVSGDRSQAGSVGSTRASTRGGITPVALSATEDSAAPGQPATAADESAAAGDVCSWPSDADRKQVTLSGEDVALLSKLGLMDESAQRLPDGSIFLPKVTQRLLEVRTAYTCKGTVATTRRLVGHVIANPTSSGLVQAEQNGRIESGEFGFPVIGQRVEKGQLLGYLVPILSSKERAELQGDIALVRGQIAEQELAIARTRELPLLPFREGRILSMRIELSKLRARRDALVDGLSARQPLTASVSGVIARSEVRVGQVVEERELLWEIADTDDLWVEADSFGTQTDFARTGSTAETQDGQVMDLVLQGLGLSTDGAQSSPVQFRVDGIPRGVRIGQQVVVNIRELGSVDGVLVPRSALVRRSNGEMIVWVAKGPEQYESRKVKWTPAGSHVAIIDAGLEDGVRVVVAGATLLSEVR